jgi:hypothetical protein
LTDDRRAISSSAGAGIPKISQLSRVWCAASSEKWSAFAADARDLDLQAVEQLAQLVQIDRLDDPFSGRDLANRTLGSMKSSSASTYTPHSRSGSKTARARNERASWRVSWIIASIKQSVDP